MDAQSKTEIKTSKLVDEAIAKIEALNGAKDTPPEARERLKEILTTLALKSAVAGAPDKCKECGGKLDPRFRDRCPKHIGLLLAADFGRNQVREHGPALAMKAAMGLQGWLEKLGAPAESSAEDKDEAAKSS